MYTSPDERLLMTPGPTALPPSVREAMGRELINPDVDPAFQRIYESVTDKLAEIYGADQQVVIPGGEGILGLEMAIESLVEPGTRVLCLANGLYGAGFADFVENAGGEATTVSAADTDPLPIADFEREIETGAYDVATMVHCETPTGTLNHVEPALELCAEHEVVSVVDAVSSLGGTPVPADMVDVCLGASQKCFSAPPGLTTAAISDAAWDRMESTTNQSLYTNFLPWKDTRDGFPYTHLTTNVVALDEALSLVLEEGLDSVYDRHERAAAHCRDRGAALGLTLYPDSGSERTASVRSSPTVTAFSLPGRAVEIQRELREEHDIVLATGLGAHESDILRIGHMGYNASVDAVDTTMDALERVL